MRQRLRIISSALLAALILTGTVLVQAPTGAESRPRLAANHLSGVDLVPVQRVMRAVKRANLRSGPATHFDKVGVLEVGQQVRVTGEVGGWLRVEAPNGRTAFVYAPLLGDVTSSAEPTAAERRAVWQIHNVRPGETFGKRKDHSRGTAFAIGPSNFISNIHVLLGLLERDNALAATTLLQDGSPAQIKVKQVLAVNVAHDLALLETHQRVNDYLRFSDEDASGPGEQLFVMGYLDGFTRQEITNGMVYEDIFSFAVATDFPDLEGMSGSPILDARGRVAGVGYFAEGNMLYGVKINHVKAFIAGKSGTVCSQHASLESCLLAGARQVKEMAAGGDVQAVYELGDGLSNVHRIDSSMGVDLDALADAVLQGYAHAAFDLAELYAKLNRNDEDLENAFTLFKQAAAKGHPASVFELGRYYFNGWGTQKDMVLGRFWIKKSSDQGFLPAKEYLKKIGG